MFLATQALKNASSGHPMASRHILKPDELAVLIQHASPSCEFFQAIAGGQLDQTRRMLDSNPSMADAHAGNGITPLGFAAFSGHADIAHVLLSLGARVNQVSADSRRETALHCAVARGQVEVAQLLLEWGADIDARQVGDFTPLHIAAQNGDAAMAKLLLSYNPDTTAQTTEGATALDIALAWSHHEVAVLLRHEQNGV